MPAINPITQIPRSSTSTWATLHHLLNLSPRQNFNYPNNASNLHSGLHPAAIFGIVAGVMLAIIITVWVCWFRLVKKALTHREYGVLPSIRTAANNRNNGGQYPYGQYGAYGNNNMSGGYDTNPTQFPPPTHHHDRPPAYDPGNGNSPHKGTDPGFGGGHGHNHGHFDFGHASVNASGGHDAGGTAHGHMH